MFLLMYVYGLNTELIDGSSKFEVKTFKTIRQYTFVRSAIYGSADDVLTST